MQEDNKTNAGAIGGPERFIGMNNSFGHLITDGRGKYAK